MTAEALLRDEHVGRLDDEAIRAELSGNICRCTGYAAIVAAVRSIADQIPIRETSPGSGSS